MSQFHESNSASFASKTQEKEEEEEEEEEEEKEKEEERKEEIHDTPEKPQRISVAQGYRLFYLTLHPKTQTPHLKS